MGSLQEVLVFGSFIVTNISVYSLSSSAVGSGATLNSSVDNASCPERTLFAGEGVDRSR